VVVARDGVRRREWGQELKRAGASVIGCSSRECPLLGGRPCALLASADLAVYDEETLNPALFLALTRARPRPTILFARDHIASGRHHAKFVRVLDHRGAATIFPHLA
jgi:hypothetical protein